MTIDVNLLLDQGQVLAATANTPAIDTEGGYLMWACLKGGTMSGASTTFDAYVQYSKDGGTNYYMAGKHQQFGPTDDNKFSRIPVYIPRPTTPGQKVKVRIRYVLAGSSPSYAVTRAWLEPMLSLAPEATDEALGEGAALAMAAL